MFYTQYNRPDDPGEINSGELLVETAGYVPAEQRIRAIMMAGQRLVESRRAEYDYDSEDDISEDRYDPTRDPGYDLADATQAALAIQSRIRSREPEPESKNPATEPEKTPEMAPEGA